MFILPLMATWPTDSKMGLRRHSEIICFIRTPAGPIMDKIKNFVPQGPILPSYTTAPTRTNKWCSF